MLPPAAAAAQALLVRELPRVLAEDPLFDPLAEVALETERTLGEGGMGVVRLVKDRRLGRRAALKLIKGDVTGSRAERFRREAVVTARLDHPAIPPVYELGRTSEGQQFLLMRFVAGRSLDRILADPERPPLRELVQVLVKVAEAVAYAHSRRVVHRDLKPANVMVGAFGEVLVMDWGLARDLAESPSIDAALRETVGPTAAPAAGLTAAGAMLGTLGYMPPEQARGEELDGRADVFALGAILTETLTGAIPFDAESGVELVAATMDGRVVRPRTRDPRVPPELDTIAARALAPDRAQRTASAADVAAELQAWLEARDVPGHRYGLFERAARLVRRNVTVVVSLGVIFLAALVAAGFAAAKNVEIRRRGDELTRTVEALEAEVRARAEADAARAGVERSRALLSEARARFRQGAPADGVRRLALEATQAHRSETALLDAARLLAELGEREEAEKLLRRAADDFPPGYPALFALHELRAAPEARHWMTPALAELAARARARKDENEFTLFAEATEAVRADRYEEGLALARRAVERAPRFAPAWVLSGNVRLIRRQLAEARADLDRAVDADPGSARALSLRGVCRTELGDRLGGRTDLDRAVALAPHDAEARLARASVAADRDADPEAALQDVAAVLAASPDLARAYMVRGKAWLLKDDLARAQGDATRALELDPRCLEAYSVRGAALTRLGDARGALADYEETVKLAPESAAARGNRGLVRARVGDEDGALEDLAFAIDRAPPGVRWLPGMVRTYTGILLLRRRYADVQERLDRLPPDEAKLAWVLGLRAFLAIERGDLAAGEAAASQAIDADPLRGDAWFNRASARLRRGNLDGALEDVDRAVSLDPKAARGHSLRATIRLARKEPDAARRDGERAVELDPKDARAWLELGAAREGTGDLTGALDAYGAAVRLVPDSPEPLRRRAGARRAKGDREGAARDLDQAVALEKDASKRAALAAERAALGKTP